MSPRLILLLIVLSSIILSCNNDNDSSDDSSGVDLSASISTLGEQTFLTSQSRGECKAKTFSACNGLTKTQVRFFSSLGGDTEPCTRGKASDINTYGKTTLTYSTNTCSLVAASDSVTRTLSVYEQKGDARKVMIYSNSGRLAGTENGEGDLKDYDGILRQGGSKMTFLSEAAGVKTYNLVVTGIHRESLIEGEKRGHHHITYTSEAGVTVLHDTADNSHTVNGVLFLSDKRKKITFKQTYTTVKFVPPCRHPQSGVVKFEQVGGTQTFTVTFSSATCGAATLDTAAMDLDDIES